MISKNRLFRFERNSLFRFPWTRSQNFYLLPRMNYRRCMDVLRKKFAGTRSRNQSYTLRSYARDLGINVTSLSLALRGERQLSLRNLQKIGHSPYLSVEEQKVFLNQKTRDAQGESNSARIRFDDDRFKLIADWEYLAILNLIKLEGFSATAKAVAERLRVSLQRAIDCLERLERLSLIEWRKGLVTRTSNPVSAGDSDDLNLRSSAIQRHHLQKLELAKSAIQKPRSQRDFSSLTFPCSVEDVPQIKKEIIAFRRAMEEKFETDHAQDVFNLSIQFFPLTDQGGPN